MEGGARRPIPKPPQSRYNGEVMGVKPKKIVFPVAGMATRFLPATKTVPKELFPLVDKPLLQYAVEEAQEAGIEEFIFVTSRRKPEIEKHFSRLTEAEEYLESIGKAEYAKIMKDCALPESAVKIVYQDEPKGLGHAVWLAKEAVGDAPFAVLLPDDAILAKTGVLKQMADFLDDAGSASLIAALEVAPDKAQFYGIIDGVPEKGHLRVKSLVEKPAAGKAPTNTAIIGRYVLQPRIFKHLDTLIEAHEGQKEIQLTDAISALAQEEPVYGFVFEGKRFDCGQCAGFVEANVAYALARPDIAPALRASLKEIL